MFLRAEPQRVRAVYGQCTEVMILRGFIIDLPAVTVWGEPNIRNCVIGMRTRVRRMRDELYIIVRDRNSVNFGFYTSEFGLLSRIETGVKFGADPPPGGGGQHTQITSRLHFWEPNSILRTRNALTLYA